MPWSTPLIVFLEMSLQLLSNQLEAFRDSQMIPQQALSGARLEDFCSHLKSLQDTQLGETHTAGFFCPALSLGHNVLLYVIESGEVVAGSRLCSRQCIDSCTDGRMDGWMPRAPMSKAWHTATSPTSFLRLRNKYSASGLDNNLGFTTFSLRNTHTLIILWIAK